MGTPPGSHATEPRRIVFTPGGTFGRDLDARVDAYFAAHGEGRRDVPRMLWKSAIIATWFAASWGVLVFAPIGPAFAALAAVSLGLAAAASGMAIQHDANHNAYSRHGWVNRFFGCALDMMGVSTLLWKQRHNVFHHTFTNVAGIDSDIDLGVLARLSPDQPVRWWHRHQHLYLWLLYGFLLPKWVFYDDVLTLFRGKLGAHPVPRPSKREVAVLVGWKVFFVGWAVVVPSLFHPVWQVLLFHLLAAFTLGVTLGTVFQLAHCVGNAEFPAPSGGRLDAEWAAHQLATTVDFAPRSAAVTWFTGGLNHQVEHHLFPKICHVHYPALARIVGEVAAAHGLRHRVHPTMFGALSSHVGHLRALGGA